MTSYFEEYTKRFFFILGKTDDEYCTEKLQLVNIEQIIHQHLQKLDYQRILFCLGSRGIYCYDEHSFKLAFSVKNVKKDSKAKKTYHHRKRGLLKGKVIGEGTPSIKKETINNKLYNDVGESNLRKYITDFMNDSNTKTAIIFPDFHDFLTHTRAEVKRELGIDLKKLFNLSSENQNIMLFITPSSLEADTIDTLGKQHNWQFLTNAIFVKEVDSLKLSNNTLLLTTPQKDELRNLLNYHRLNKSLPIQWNEFDEIIDILAKYIKESSSNNNNNPFYLKELNKKLFDLQKITKEHLIEVLDIKIEKEGLEKLQELKGLEYLHNDINKLVNYVKSNLSSEENNKKGLPKKESIERLLPCKTSFKNEINLNVALTGNPGTGKTTVAKIISQIYKDNGILEVGHLVEAKASDLIAGYVGQTAIKTQEMINKAIGGILFIDEAYKLTSTENSFGQESVDTIVEAITARQGEFAVIIAGYPKEISDFLDTNPGLQRRFANKIHINDYEPTILEDIFKSLMKKRGYSLSGNLERVFSYFIENWFNARDEKNFGNAGDVINLFDDMAKSANYEARSILEISDIPENKKIYAKEQTSNSMEEALSQLDDIIGLESVKENIKSIISSIKVSKKRNKNSKVVAGHYIFKGNPGTGKTTVARIFADVLKDLKIVPKGHFTEVSLDKLLGTVVGEAEKNTTEIINSSLGGILFIDEAHNLAKGGNIDYGKKVIATMTPLLENHRDDLVVILAGYPKEMDILLAQDPGLQSRFPNSIDFEDYKEDEMLQIYKIFSKDFILGNGVEEKLLKLFTHMKQNTTHFGNGRDVRKLFNAIKSNLDNRLEPIIDDIEDNDERLYKIELEDLNFK